MPDKRAPMPDPWLDIARDSLTRPRVAARRLLGLSVGPAELGGVAVVVTCLGIIFAYATMRLSGGAIDEISAKVLSAPVLAAMLELGVMALIGWLTFRIGALFGGRGTLWHALVLVVWLNVILLVIQLAQLAMLAVLPPAAAILSVLGLMWAVWAYANFVTELHGFENPMMVLGGVVLSAIVVFIGLAMVFALLGLTPGGAG